MVGLLNSGNVFDCDRLVVAFGITEEDRTEFRAFKLVLLEHGVDGFY